MTRGRTEYGAGVWLALLACDPGPVGPCEEDLPPPEPAGTGQNVVLVVLDDLGVDKIAAYGEHPAPPSTANLDALAAEALLFRSAYVDPTCSPTRATLLTGRRPRRHGIGDWILPSNRESAELPRDERTLPELLRDAPTGPWATALVGKWHLSVFRPDAPEDPLAQGFDHHLGTLGNPRDAFQDVPTPRGYTFWEKNTDGALAMETRYLTSVTTDDALALLDALPEPFFLQVAYNAAHEPWHAPPVDLAARPPSVEVPDLVDAMAEALDAELGRLLRAIDRATTTIVLLSDNGTTDDAVRPPWGPLGHKGSVHETGVRVPLLVAGAGVDAVGRETAALVYAADVFATIADLAGVDLADAEVDGVSFRPLLADPDQPWRRCLVAERFPVNGAPDQDLVRSVRDERYVLVADEDGEALFERAADRTGNARDLLAGERSPEVDRAWRALRDVLRVDGRRLGR